MNNKIGWIALLSALSISSVAIFFSVAGLAAIYAAAAVSIIIMGTSIEIGKLVAVAWLHNNWDDRSPFLKRGLTTFVVAVMLVTSTGIFGYLSKSHSDQTAKSSESVAQVERINSELARYKATIDRSEQRLNKYETGGSGADAAINSQIDKEQTRIDSAYDRVKPLIQTQRDIIAAEETKNIERVKPYQSELHAINKQLSDLQSALSKKQIKTAQGIVGTKPDGSYREKTQKAIRDFRKRKEARRDFLLSKIDSIRSTPSSLAKSAQQEINRINVSVKREIAQSNKTIQGLRSRLGKTDKGDVESLIAIEQKKIKESNVQIDISTKEKYELEANYRELVAEVGPLKSIAELIYGEADQNLLEKAVKWLTILIVFIFDPFAVFLLIAAQHSFEKHRRLNPKPKEAIPLNEEETEWVNAEPVGKEWGSKEWDIMEATEQELNEAYKQEVYQPVTDDLDDANPPTEDSTTEERVAKHVSELSDDEIDTIAESEVSEEYEELDAEVIEQVMPEPEVVAPYKDLQELDDLAQEIKDRHRTTMTRVGENYINFNGKVYRVKALIESFADYNLNFHTEVNFGDKFPESAALGNMFIKTDKNPTVLYMFNGMSWDRIDKNVLETDAYSKEYIEALVKKLGSGQYNPELLNKTEARHIEDMLSQE